MPKNTATTLRDTKQKTVRELEELQQKDTTHGFVVVLMCTLLTYLTYSVLRAYTSITWFWTAFITVGVGIVLLIALFSLLGARTHIRNAKRRRSLRENYERDLTSWLVSQGKNGSIEYQGDILGDTVGVRHQNQSGIEYFTVADNGKSMTIKS